MVIKRLLLSIGYRFSGPGKTLPKSVKGYRFTGQCCLATTNKRARKIDGFDTCNFRFNYGVAIKLQRFRLFLTPEIIFANELVNNWT